MSLSCPNCKTPMNLVKTQGHYGAHIAIEQCPQCAGIWFDQFEFTSISPTEIEQLDDLDRENLKTPHSIYTVLHCPKDNTQLDRFSDPNFPASIDIERCPQCHGYWFNHGELTDFHQHRLKNQQTQEIDPALLAEIDQMLANESSASKYQALQQLGTYLNTNYYQLRHQQPNYVPQKFSHEVPYHLLQIIRLIINMVT